MKLIQAFCLAILLLSTGSAWAQETRISAIVNDDVVSINDLDARMNLVLFATSLPDTPQNRTRLEPRVLRTLIDERLELQEAKRLNLKITNKQIDQALERIEKQNNLPKGSLDSYLTQHGVTREALVAQVKASLAWNKVVQYRLSQDVSISDEEINDAMARLKENANVPQNRVSEIFLAIDNPTQEAEVKQLADKLINQIRSGVKFDAVARQFSQSPTAAVGGDLGWVTPDQLMPALGNALKKMNPGEMSYPLRAGGGYYILYLLDRRTLGAPNPADTLLSLVEVVLPLPGQSPPADQQRVLQQALQISGEVKSCGELAKIGRDEAPQTSREMPSIKAGELPANLQKPVLALAIAQASKPLPVPGGVAVIMVCQKKAPTGGMPTREEVADSLARERLDALARRYLGDLRRGAYVDIRG